MANNPLASLPPQPQFTPGDLTFNDRWNAWIVQANAAMEDYKAQYSAEMAGQGIRVTFDQPQSNAGNPMGVPPVFTATLSKDGFSTTSLLSLGRAQNTDPEALAEYDQNFNLKWQAQVTTPAGTDLPSPWYAPPAITPGPATTVPVGNTSTQPTQAPPQPNAGTNVTPPANTSPNTGGSGGTAQVPPGSERFTFWQWNWKYEQQTGRVGPPPEDVGVLDGNQLMTKGEWEAAVAAWYGTGGTTGGQNSTPSGGSGGGGGGTTSGGGTGSTGGNSAPPAKDNTLLILAGIAAVGLFVASQKG